MTTQDDKSDSSQGGGKTQLRPSMADWTLNPKDPTHEGQTFPVRGEVLIGREGCDITLTGSHASRKHAKVSLVGGVLRLEDLGSANGTFVNDERIEAAELKPGDEVRFDTETFTVDGPQPESPEPPVDEGRTVLRPAAPQQPAEPVKDAEPVNKPQPEPRTEAAPEHKPPPDGGEPGKEVESGKQAQPQEPAAGAEAGARAPEDNQEEPARGAWYERDTPNLTRKMDPGALQNQFAEGATQIVRGVKGVEMPSLIGTSGDWSGRVITLDREAMTIGRAGTDIILDEPSVSTKHAQIVRDGERWKIVDLMSANHVFVNGKRTQVAYLSPGDAVRFGHLEMRFVIDSTDVASHAAGENEDMIVGADRASGKGGTWLYIAVGFVVVLVVGAYLLFAS